MAIVAPPPKPPAPRCCLLGELGRCCLNGEVGRCCFLGDAEGRCCCSCFFAVVACESWIGGRCCCAEAFQVGYCSAAGSPAATSSPASRIWRGTSPDARAESGAREDDNTRRSTLRLCGRLPDPAPPERTGVAALTPPRAEAPRPELRSASRAAV